MSPTAASVTPMSPLPTAALVARYSKTFTSALPPVHGVSSALGAWLLIALLAPAGADDTKVRLETLLGTTAEDAFARAVQLVEVAPDAVRAALAVWAEPAHLNTHFAEWAGQLQAPITRGPMPTKATADEWVSTNTGGLITEFPTSVNPETDVVLASALATDVRWNEPFDDVDPARLGGTFGAQVSRALSASASGHRQFLLDTEAAGIVAVHVADTDARLNVMSVIADTHVSPSDVHCAALEAATFLWGREMQTAQQVSLFDLDLGDGHAWTISQRTVTGMGSAHEERFTTLLPTWRSDSHWGLNHVPGIAEALEVLAGFSDGMPVVVNAVQAAMAEYSSAGFRAAAVTTTARGAASNMPRLVRQRHAEVRFNRPYAVVALCDWGPRAAGKSVAAWSTMPVFSAWVAAACDVPDRPPLSSNDGGKGKVEPRSL